jgi:biopolymer transport protein ExbB/TolQ
MSSGAHGTSRLAYPGTFAMLGLALAFPVGLMIFNPTLMFERGWEQYVGTTIYVVAVLTLTRELIWLRSNERAFADAPAFLDRIRRRKGDHQPSSGAIPADDRRILPARLRQLGGYVEETYAPTVAQLMELNREGSGLDQEHAAGRFTLTRYILYLLPVIGFIGTVEGISKALMNISKVLPMVKNLDGFMNNLTGVTSALQIAFDSTLLALFLSAALMLVQTLVFRRSEDLLARVDRWVVENVLPGVGHEDPMAAGLAEAIGPHLDRLRIEIAAIIEPAARAFQAQSALWAEQIGTPIDQFSRSVDRLPLSLAAFQQGAESIGRLGDNLGTLAVMDESIRYGVGSLSRIETTLANQAGQSPQLDEIKEGIDRTCVAIETLANSLSLAYERSNRATQEQLARTLNSLKDALDLLNVSMEQGNSLYRNIVKKMFSIDSGVWGVTEGRDERAA